MRKALLALALLFLLTHIFWSPSAFGDIDALNFALGVRDFDVARHQPHPPGYPVYIAAAKLSRWVVAATGVTAPDVRGLSLLAVIAGTLTIPVLFVLFRTIVRDAAVAAAGAVIATAAPLFWFTSLRPLSDVPGLFAALVAQALLVGAILRRSEPWAATALVAGAAVAGLSIGVRSQSFTLTLPLLAIALVLPGIASWRIRIATVGVLAVAGLAWAIPLIVLSGGPDGYIAALGDQAGEDFTGAVMLWTTRTPRALLNTLQYTFLWPWGNIVAGAIVMTVAAIGLVRMSLRDRMAVLVLALAFLPYAVFHLVFQETVMTRYALPLIPPIALLAAYGAAGGGRTALAGATGVFVIFALAVAVPPARVLAQTGTPGARIVADAFAVPGATTVGMHAVMLRFDEWYRGNAPGTVIRARHGQEVLALVDHWRREPESVVAFMADETRSDLAMLDPQARGQLHSYDWGFPEMPLVGGARPSRVALYRIAPPGWMLDQGWAVTAEVAGQSFRAGARPELRPSVAWVRSRENPALMVIGGRHLGAAGAPPAQLTIRVAGTVLHTFEVQPGFFFQTLEVPAGTLRGSEPYVPLTVEAVPTGAGDVRVSLEQFDLQGSSAPMFGFLEGWQEPEYDRLLGLAWRWLSARGDLWVRPIGRDVTLHLRGESPLRYFDAAPSLRVTIGGQAVATLSPDADFEWDITLPAALLERHAGRVTIESDKSFVPGGSASGDQRQLALRVFAVSVN